MADLEVGERRVLIGPDTPGLDREHDLHDVNGPSLIRVPEWLTGGLGRYHLYFAHHVGSHIRLAFADELTGPWTVHPGGALDMSATPATGQFPHVASPDVHLDHDERRVRMYFHAPLPEAISSHLPSWGRYPSFDQHTLAAVSTDGVHFQVVEPQAALAPSYLRMFRWNDHWYGLAMPGQLVRSTDGMTDVEYGPDLFGDPEIRHSAVLVEGQTLTVWYTRAGDAPECILSASVALDGDWTRWRPSTPQEVLRPVETWEGAELPVEPSVRGAASGPRHELRDPFVFDDEGCRYLVYSAAAETALAIVRLT